MSTPLPLSSFPKEYYALIELANTTEDGVLKIPVATRAAATTLTYTLNRMRKSLEFWAPSHRLSKLASQFKFTKGAPATHGTHMVVIEPRLPPITNLESLKGFSEVLAEVEIPTPEKKNTEANESELKTEMEYLDVILGEKT